MTSTTDNYVFHSPADWETLRHQIKIRAEGAEGEDIWIYVQEGGWPTRPEIPQLVADIADTTPPSSLPPARSTRSSSTAGPSTAVPPATPGPDDPVANVPYSERLQDYLVKEARFRRILKGKTDIKTWLMGAVTRTYRITCCSAGDLHDWYKNLEEASAAEMKNFRDDTGAMMRYEDVYDMDLKNGRDFLQWVQKWEEAMQEGQMRKVPQCLVASLWTQKLFKKVIGLLPHWPPIYEMIKTKEIQENTLSFRAVAADLKTACRWHLTSPAPKGKVSRGILASRAAAYGDEEEEEEDVEEQPPKKKARQQGGNNNIRRGGGSRGRGKHNAPRQEDSIR